MDRVKIVAGNWKLNGNKELLSSFDVALQNVNPEGVKIVICPPYPYLAHAKSGSFLLGAQDISVNSNGAFTGEVAGEMLVDVGCDFAVVGHSERRQYHGETDALVAQKTVKAVAAGLTPIVCIGEPLEIREANQYLELIEKQVAAVVSAIGDSLSKIVFAYEPVWAIGTGKTASPEQAQEVHAFIREQLRKTDADVAEKVQILYGGSVKASNAEELFAQADIDGGLIGGASLKTEEFTAICQAAG